MSFNLKKIVRPNILAMDAYSSARDEFDTEGLVMLDANENPFGEYNRYPDPYATDVRNALALKKQINVDQIFLGNGSDEAIDLLIRIFCKPGQDKIGVFPPTYGMYKVSAATNDIGCVEFPLDESFQPQQNSTDEILSDSTLKVLFFCSPNNPTGNLMDISFVQEILTRFQGIVVVDEAYIDFAEEHSWVRKINNYPNLVVLQTFSKARGLAGIRVGMACANAEIIALFDKIKPPYNVNILSQVLALDSLLNDEPFHEQVDLIISERKQLEKDIAELPYVTKVFPSRANFLLIQMDDATGVYKALIDKGVVTRNRSSVVSNCLRITIGSPEENNRLLEALNKIQ